MSGNPSQRPRQSAGDFVRSLLDDRPPEEVSPSGELYRAIEEYHQNNRSDWFTNPISTSSSSGIPTGPYRSLQRRFSREPASRDTLSSPSFQPPLPPLRSLSRRIYSMASGGGSNLNGRPTRQRPSERLDSSNTHLRHLLDFPSSPLEPPLRPPSPPFPVYAHNPSEDNRRAKRRKLDSDRLIPTFKGFRYGRYGQVEPGQLTMEIVTCDGAISSDGAAATSAAENILNNDSSIYRARGNRCNIVLRHQGATVFSLKELVIKVPSANCPSPAREGMVFISMNKDELLTRTTQYQIQYLPVRCFGRNGAERDPRNLTAVVSIRHQEDGSTIPTRIQPGARRVYSILDDQDDYIAAQIPSEFTVPPPPFRVTTECSDEEGDDPNRRHRRRTPNRIGSLPFESDSSDDWGHVDEGTFGDSRYLRYVRGEGSEQTSLQDAVEASQLATQEAVRAVGGELMAPHARFFLEKDKSRCTIRFDPPVSGRFILLKMWSPHPDPAGAIDIQAVIAKGFAGPRYFPAVELR